MDSIWYLLDGPGSWIIAARPTLLSGEIPAGFELSPSPLPLERMVRMGGSDYRSLVQIYEEVLQRNLRRPPGPHDLAQLLEGLEQALERGDLVGLRSAPTTAVGAARRHEPRPDTPAEDIAPADLPPPAPPSPEEEEPVTWFEVEVVDEVGEPVDGVGLDFALHGPNQRVVTGADGKARVDGVRETTGAVAIADPQALRAAVGPRWDEVRSDPPLADSADTTRVYLQKQIPGVAVLSEMPHTLIITPKIVRVRLIGMFFDTSKCFLLPKAMKGIKKVKLVYDQHDEATLLVVGHTDTAGPNWYNEPLSLERAGAVAAYLQDQHDAWLKWYDSGDSDKRWGTKEDQHMLSVLPWGEVPYYRGKPTGALDAETKAALTRYQQAKGLPATGKADRATREALVTDYMALDGTTLPAEDEIVVHGCGPYFNAVETGPGVALEANRRVEVFVFDGPVQPPPPGKISKPGTLQYLTWEGRTVETIDFTAGAVDESDVFRVRLHDDQARPLTEAAYRVRVPGQDPIEDLSGDGWVEIGFPKDMCFEAIEIDWVQEADGTYRYSGDFILECSEGTEKEQATAKLHNLGFPITMPYDEAVRAFQNRYGIEESGLSGDALPPMTKAKLWSIYEGDCDATPGRG